MINKKLLKYIESIRQDKNFIKEVKKSEENVKIKFLVPFFNSLGYDIIHDMDFEVDGVDILLKEKLKPLLIVEAKSWHKTINNFLDQGLEYSLKFKNPFVVFSSGYYTALYCSLINPDNLKKTKPILSFYFSDLIKKDNKSLLKSISSFLSKRNLLNKKIILKRAETLLLSGQSIEQAKRQFFKKCQNFQSKSKVNKINEEQFFKKAEESPEEICKAFKFAKDKFCEIERKYQKITTRYHSNSFGLKFKSSKGPRDKIIGLAGLYPEDSRVCFGLKHWQELGISTRLFKTIKEFDRNIKNRKHVEKLIGILEKGVEEINKE